MPTEERVDYEPVNADADGWFGDVDGDPEALQETDADARQATHEQASEWLSCFYTARIVAQMVVLAMDWNKPCDQPLQMAVMVMLAIDLGRLSIRNASFEVQTSTEMKRVQLILELVHVNIILIAFTCLWRTDTCSETAPNLWRLVFAILVINIGMVALCSLFLLCSCVLLTLAVVLRGAGMLRHPGEPAAASMEFIESLPVIRYERKSEEEGSDDSVCSICLDAFDEDDMVRKLPCGHIFHVPCVDKWLRINRTCPLCKADIEDPAALSAQSDTADEVSNEATEAMV